MTAGFSLTLIALTADQVCVSKCQSIFFDLAADYLILIRCYDTTREGKEEAEQRSKLKASRSAIYVAKQDCSGLPNYYVDIEYPLVQP